MERDLAHHPFASSPFVVGNSTPAPVEPHIPAEESLAPVVSHDWVNAEYKHLVVEASPKALAVKPGQFFNLLCPSPDEGELWLRRPQSVYRIDRAQRPPRVSLQMRRPRHARAGDARARRRPQHGRAARRRLHASSPAGRTSWCSAAASALPPLAPISQLAGEQRRRRDRDPERAQRGIRDGGRSVRARSATSSACSTPTAPARSRTSKRSCSADRRAARPTPSTPAAPTACCS